LQIYGRAPNNDACRVAHLEWLAAGEQGHGVWRTAIVRHNSQRITHFTEELPFLSEQDKDWVMGKSILERLRWAEPYRFLLNQNRALIFVLTRFLHAKTL
jgi:hypothetical protein